MCTHDQPLPNMLGKPFDSLAKRILYSYIATYPVFLPVPDISESSQRQMHAFMRDTLRRIYDDPALIGAPDAPDDCYRGSALNNSKPELIAAMEKIENKFITFIESLIMLGKAGTATPDGLYVPKQNKTIAKALADRLAALGLTVSRDKQGALVASPMYPELFEAWTAYAAQDDETAQKVTRALTFIHARYSGRVYRAGDFFGALMGDTSVFERLEAFFDQNGYALSNFDINNKTRYAYVKWLKEYPGKEIGSLRIYYNWRKDWQLTIEFKVPCFRTLLDSADGFDTWDAQTRVLVFQRLKTCDGCGYCTQTDKTGKRPRLCAPRTLEGKTENKCPLYPWFIWREGLGDEAGVMLDLFEKAEAFIAKG